ncbi:MAG: hypothetical protein ABIK18_03295, partial [candidate division WOR-3 bacterium]
AHHFRRDELLLFSESNSRFLCEVSPAQAKRFERYFRGIPHGVIGKTNSDGVMVITGLTGAEVVKLNIEEAERVWRRSLTAKL